MSSSGARAGRIAPAILRFVVPILRPVVRLAHRPVLSGFENLPPGGQAYLLVANHSAGIGQAEIVTFALMYLDALRVRGESQEERPLAGFAHVFGFRVPIFRTLMRSVGAIPSTYEDAHQTLASGVPLLVFPGGEHETLRPVWQANLVDFGGRKGFLRIARTANIPIIPLGIRGSHFTAPILLRSRLLSRVLLLPLALGLKRWGISLLGVIGAAVIVFCFPQWPIAYRLIAIWLWLSSPFIFMSWIPWPIRMRIGKPIPSTDLFSDDDEDLSRAYERVVREVQKLVDV